MLFHRPVYPFSAIVGQDKFKLALILNALDPAIGGVLFTGAKGTGKSLTVRSVIDILPEVEVVFGCDFNCNPSDPTNMCEECRSSFGEGNNLRKESKRMRIVQIPISATEDRVIGTIDVEKTLRDGVKGFQPGLLAEANQNLLYIDEVNLLPDHLIDMILDSAASGWNIVEREGVSVVHPSRFTLIGSMNPEEGDLRPQILDRFSLHVEADNLLNSEERIEVIKRNEDFEEDPSSFLEDYEAQQQKLIRKIESAKKLLNKVKIPKSILESVAKVCATLHVDGYRPDIVTVRTARALAAFHGRMEIKPEDVLQASELALSHRTRRSGLLAPPSNKEIMETLKTTPIGKLLIRKKSTKEKIIDILSRLTPKEMLKRLRTRYVMNVITFTALIFFLVNLLTISYIQILQPIFPQLNSSLIFSFKGFILTSSVAVITATIISEWLKRTLRKRRRRLPTRFLDFSKIITEYGISPKKIVEEFDESARNPTEVIYTGQTTLERGLTTLGSLRQPLKPPETIMGKPQPSMEERTRLGQGYVVGKRAKTVASTHRGRYVWYELPKERPWDIALGPTIRAAAPHQLRRKTHKLSVAITNQDVRVKMREYRAPFTIILLVDMSWSMINSMENLGRTILSLHRSVYRRRDRVGLIIFKGSDAFIIQQPTTNLDFVVKKLSKVKASDYTPMAAGMLKAWKVLRLEKIRNKDAVPMLIIVSDGITNVSLKRPLSMFTRQRFLIDSQADVLDVARLLARDGIRTFIINTSHRQAEMSMMKTIYYESRTLLRYMPTKFLMEVAEIAGGSYYGLSLRKEGGLLVESNGARLEDWFYFEESNN